MRLLSSSWCAIAVSQSVSHRDGNRRTSAAATLYVRPASEGANDERTTTEPELERGLVRQPGGRGERYWDGEQWTDQYRQPEEPFTKAEQAEDKWWSRQFAIPVWALIASAIVLLAIGSAMAGDEEGQQAAEPGETVTVTATETVTAEPETQQVAEEAEEEEPAEPEGLSPEEQEARFVAFIEENRADLAEAIESDHQMDGVESADRLTYDAENQRLDVAVTTGWGTDQYRHDAGWALTRSLAGLFWSGDIEWMDEFSPALQLSVDHLTYSCPADVMEQIASRTMARDGWESSC